MSQSWSIPWGSFAVQVPRQQATQVFTAGRGREARASTRDAEMVRAWWMRNQATVVSEVRWHKLQVRWFIWTPYQRHRWVCAIYSETTESTQWKDGTLLYRHGEAAYSRGG